VKLSFVGRRSVPWESLLLSSSFSALLQTVKFNLRREF
jgi:hypothetical protein